MAYGGLCLAGPTVFADDADEAYKPRNAASGSIDYEIPVVSGHPRIKLRLDANYSQAMQSRAFI